MDRVLALENWALSTTSSLGYGSGPTAQTDAEFLMAVGVQVCGACVSVEYLLQRGAGDERARRPSRCDKRSLARPVPTSSSATSCRATSSTTNGYRAAFALLGEPRLRPAVSIAALFRATCRSAPSSSCTRRACARCPCSTRPMTTSSARSSPHAPPTMLLVGERLPHRARWATPCTLCRTATCWNTDRSVGRMLVLNGDATPGMYFGEFRFEPEAHPPPPR